MAFTQQARQDSRELERERRLRDEFAVREREIWDVAGVREREAKAEERLREEQLEAMWVRREERFKPEAGESLAEVKRQLEHSERQRVIQLEELIQLRAAARRKRSFFA